MLTEREVKQARAEAPKPKAVPDPFGKGSSASELRQRIGNGGMQALARQQPKLGAVHTPPFLQEWLVRAAAISKEEELRSRQQLRADGVAGENAGRNDIYDAERHARWMYRLTREVGLATGWIIGGLKEVWGQIKGAGGAETAMDFYNNEIGRREASEGNPIPSRHKTETLIYIDEKTGALRANRSRLVALRAGARAKVGAKAAFAGGAARPKPIAESGGVGASRTHSSKTSSPDAERLSGKAWWHAHQAEFPNSAELADLASPFRENVIRFTDALKAAGATVRVSATRRNEGRARLMNACWRVANGSLAPADVPPIAGCDIIWDHGDEAASRKGAQEMVNLFGIAFQPSTKSLHIAGRAIDMTIGWAGTIEVVDAQGHSRSVSAPRSGHNKLLQAIGATYGVKKLASDPPHWSDTGH